MSYFLHIPILSFIIDKNIEFYNIIILSHKYAVLAVSCSSIKPRMCLNNKDIQIYSWLDMT